MKKIIVTAAVLALSGIGTAMAAFPERPVTIVVGAAPGGGTDVQARILAEKLSAKLGQQVLVENKPGAGGNIAQVDVKGAAPDGYRIVMMAPAGTINHTLYENPGFDMVKDFTAIAAWAESPLLFVANPGQPYNTLQELADYAKANPDELDYGNGIGFINQMVMELFKLESGAPIQLVPYPGMAPARTDVVGGQIEVTVDSIASSGSFVESGQLKALAVTSKERLARFPNVPTVTEAGYPNVTRNTWYGLVGPANMPADVVKTLADAVAEVQADEETKAKIEASGASPVVMGPAEFQALIEEEVATWAKVIEASGQEKVK